MGRRLVGHAMFGIPKRLGSAAGSAPASIWLINDDFSDGDATSPRDAIPGPGQWVIGGANAAAQFSVADGNWNVAGGTGVTAYKMASEGIARSAGLMYTVPLPNVIALQASRFGFGVSNDTRPLQAALTYGAAGDSLAALHNGVDSPRNLTLPITSIGRVFIVLAASGAYHLAEVDGVLRLVWIDTFDTVSPVFPGMGFNAASPGAYSYSDERVRQLAAPWTSLFPVVHQTHLGTQTLGTTFSHPADAIIRYTVETKQTTGPLDMIFRMQDEDNWYALRLNTSSTINLRKRSAGGSPANVASASLSTTNGAIIMIRTFGNTIRIYGGQPNVIQNLITYVDADFNTAIAGRFDADGEGTGAVRDILVFPYTVPNGAAKTELYRGIT